MVIFPVIVIVFSPIYSGFVRRIMKRIALVLFVCLLITQTGWAAGRAKVSSIAKDPYISALVVDAETGKVLFADHAEAVVYPASVLKLMNLLVLLERIEQGTLRLDEMVQVTREAAKTGGSQVYLDPKEQFPVEDLLYALMVQSANDAAVALATHVAGSKEGFVALMNKKAQDLGMKNTHFYSVHGLPPSEGQKPDETTAGDMSILCRELANRPEAIKYTSTRERGFRDNTFIMRNHNHLLAQVDGCDGLKTGYFEAAGFSIAATAQRGGVRIIALVMGSKDRKVRDAKASELLAKGFSILPPKPGAAPVAGRPDVTAKKAETVAAPETQAVQMAEKKKEAPTSTGGGWGKFFMGLGAGLVLFGLLAVFISRKRPKENSRYGRHS
jgi:D-alanyl-D-alanine carboxypeptidase (penicillin-binding protein 5/6)